MTALDRFGWKRGQDHDGVLRGLEAIREADGADVRDEINDVVREASLLTDDELDAIRARAREGNWDELDATTLIDHIDATKAQRDERNEQLREQLMSLREAIVVAAFRVNTKVLTPLEALESICAANRRLNHEEGR